MLLFLLSLNTDRNCELGFSRILSSEDTAQTTTATKRGASNFMLCGIKGGMGAITNIQIPDVMFSINAGVTTVDLSLKDIKIAQVLVPNIEFDLNNPIQSQMNLLNCTVNIKFQWKLQQQSYPYATDSGSGQFIITNGEMKGVVNSTADTDECPGHMIVGFVRAEVDYESLKIILDGGDSWLFQSLINLILSEVEEKVVSQLSEVLLKGFIGLINNVFEDNHRLNEFQNNWNVMKDERYTSGIYTSNYGYATLRMSGYVYYKNNLKDEYITQSKLSPFTYNKFNNDMQIAIHEAVFNNAFYINHKYENKYSNDKFQTIQAPEIVFYNTAALFSINVTVNGTVVHLKLLSKLLHENDLGCKKCWIFFDFSKYEVFSEDSTIDLELIQQQVIDHLNSIIKFASYQLNYTPTTDLNQYTHMFDAAERVIRLIGPEEYVCPF
ncbi:Conserved_hypothetical protein [Hexamita inflata]|uniref:Lipid-binding serum glycoprotein N-terminal domain-containing protein n=1 Tax=Hexamita inflata TaxID=28002 RepID=A0AA86UU69_9EUKA|nr:Conserved hypothetical protein [Hexamita inflata]